MWRVNPYMIGSVENLNLATAKAARVQHAEINIEPRLRQFVKQLNASLVRTYDPSFELAFASPVPEDGDAKLKEAQAGVNKWWTIDKVREQYGDAPLPDNLGGHVYIANNNAPLSAIAEPAAPAPAAGKSLKYKQVSANDFPGLYDDIDMVDGENLGCIMLNTETIKVTKFVEDGQADLLPPVDDHERGAVAERSAHVTLLFGLLENGNVWKEKVDALLDDWERDSVTIKDVTALDLGESYAIVGLIKKTPELTDGHERLTLLPHIQTFSEYKPHITMAYVEHDEAVAEKWVNALRAEYKGATLKTTGIDYGDKPDEATKSLFSLNGEKKN